MEEEYFFTCPYCWSDVSVLLDLSIDEQTYIEDCEICCNPIEISYRVDNHEEVYRVGDEESDDEPRQRDDDWDVWDVFNENAEVVDFEARRIDD